MTKKVTNHHAGPRGINLGDGSTRWVAPGETVDLSGLDVKGDLPDFGKPADQSERDADALENLRRENEDLRARLASLDGSRHPTAPALTGKGKDELLAIAKAEGVDVPEGATNDAIREAIKAKREG